MNYEESLAFIHGRQYKGMKLGLDNITKLMELLGNPQNKLKFIHIAGTNGKGSTASFINQVLIKAGYKTGLFTSPYLERFNERIKINNQDVPDNQLSDITNLIKTKIDEMEDKPTEFEIVTAIAFQYFYEQQCDVVVLEVGLGGRFDSTNVIEKPLLSVITSIGLDHQAFLGNTLAEIAFEKAGIIKENSQVLLYPQTSEVEAVIHRVAAERNSTVDKADFTELKRITNSIDGQTFYYNGYQELRISLLGEHQLKNAAIAIEAIEILRHAGLTIHEDDMREGLAETKWPGRFEIINRDPLVVIDGAHNLDGIHALVLNIRQLFSGRRIIGILGILKDKDYQHMIEEVSPVIDQFITVTPDNPRAIPADELASYLIEHRIPAIAADSYDAAVELAYQESGEKDVICAFGSLYYIGEIKRVVQQR
ncbi:bifunctional folylpolyglutamate synthase/dihydrofolate synthase [Oceanobacillus chungangensis]|uniref:Dihydrofolate synthase/folylpolyglutamate synthase n=1 Tax=Oceanobacillus chungangensis TaxID=1229152 RepID=A0A3D8PUS2_9BACI|nr:folylpolyglutamate synthase/dihydrofolate synthase family protein [Oceanobacillus chungangensis]RDW19754.1 bifunctional folylpolyglutamate synthase/dihydrofolate synthase [Oceanobacillus chungangensis]